MRRAVAKIHNQQPLQIVIFGGTGDLADRKLIPALFDLYEKNCLPSDLSIIGVAKSRLSTAQFQRFVEESLSKVDKKISKRRRRAFCKHVSYISGLFDEDQTYEKLTDAMQNHDSDIGHCTNKLYYLAVPPQFYENLFRKLHAHRLHRACDAQSGWARVLVEKPFGRDHQSAQKLDDTLASLFDESQIYRIDHYLAKENVQNILSFRFANRLLQGLWSKEHIEEVHITMHEELDVDDRGAFYDSIGALRDVGQNHLLQLFALLTMKEPRSFSPEHIRAARSQALAALKTYTRSTAARNVVRGQYKGYRSTKGVAKGSTTETFFALKLFSNVEHWAGVPFYMTAGKALNESKVEVSVHLKDVTRGLFGTKACRTTSNVITLTISPERSMHITLNAKQPGLNYQIENRTLSFDCPPEKGAVQDAYQKVLLDCIEGDQTLFTTTEEVLASWKFIGSILHHFEEVPLASYAKGSRGPKVPFHDKV